MTAGLALSTVQTSLTLPLLRKLRWTAVAGQATAVTLTVAALKIPLPVGPIAACIAFTAVTNLWLHRIRPGNGERPGQLATILAADVALLTLLLHYTGGAHNPFTSFFLVHVALAAVALPPGLTFALVAECAAGYGALFFGDSLLPRPGDAVCGIGPNLPLSIHLKGMLVSFILTAAAIALFVGRLQAAWRRGEAALALTRARAAENERFAAVATLAAGAAHELGTPLGTIGIAASELTRAAARHPEDTELCEDAQLIREEVRRCRQILDRLGNPAVDPPEPLRIQDILTEVTSRFDPAPIHVAPPSSGDRLVAPRQALVQALTSLVKNALDASPPNQPVRIESRCTPGQVEFSIIDHGIGLSLEARTHAGEPFFTTKPPGHGMGLGLFLVRLLAQRLGGDFALVSQPEGGVRAILRLPRSPGALHA